jgi:uncharacterized membrane protein YphA (DoxX/SURF4 family)
MAGMRTAVAQTGGRPVFVVGDRLRCASAGAVGALRIAEGIVGALLVFGLWTPAAAIGLVLIHLWCAASVASAGEITVINMFLGLSLAMLGPGAWSVDARLYGRKRIEL